VTNLRAVLAASPLQLSTGVFPLLLDHVALHDGGHVFPLARVMLDEPDPASSTGCRTRLVQVISRRAADQALAAGFAAAEAGQDANCGETATGTKELPRPGCDALSGLAASLMALDERDEDAHAAVRWSAGSPPRADVAGALWALDALRHPNVAAIHAVHATEEHYIVESELAEQSLRSLGKYNRQALQLPEIWAGPGGGGADGPRLLGADPVGARDAPGRLLVLQCLLALKAVHDAGLVHGGVCPDAYGVGENLLVKLRPPTFAGGPAAPSAAAPGQNLTAMWRRGEVCTLGALGRRRPRTHAPRRWQSTCCTSTPRPGGARAGWGSSTPCCRG
jgi:hypothetical protein